MADSHRKCLITRGKRSAKPPRPCTLGINRTTAQACGLTIPSSRLEQADDVQCVRGTDASFAPTILARMFGTFRPRQSRSAETAEIGDPLL